MRADVRPQKALLESPEMCRSMGDSLGDLDRPTRILETLSCERGVAQVQEPQRLSRWMRHRLGSLQRAIHNVAQVGKEGFVVCDVVVCPRLERRGRSTHFLWRDDDYWCGQPAAANVMDEGRAALILYLGLYHQCGEIRVLLDPALRGGEASSPRESDVRRDIAKGYRGELRGAAFVRYIEDFHGSDDRDDRNVHLFYRSEVGTSAILAPAGSRDLPSRAKRTSWRVRRPSLDLFHSANREQKVQQSRRRGTKGREMRANYSHEEERPTLRDPHAHHHRRHGGKVV